MEHPDGKRKREVEKKVFMFMNSYDGTKIAAIFELDFKLATTNENGSVLIQLDYEEGQILKPLETFYDQRSFSLYENPIINSVDACVLGSKMYIFPDDGGEESIYGHDTVVDKSHTLKPCVYDLITKSPPRDLQVLPEARKLGPIVAFVGRELFVLSAYLGSMSMAPDPSFEAFDLDSGNWRELARSPIHNWIPTPIDERYTVKGHALVGEDFLIVSLALGYQQHNLIYYTYNFRTNTWKEADPPIFKDFIPGRFDISPCLSNQALVVGHNIYTHNPMFMKTFVFSYTEEDEDSEEKHDLSFGPVSFVHGLIPDTDQLNYDLRFEPFAAFAKVDDEIFCLFENRFLPPNYTMCHPVRLTFFRFKGRQFCETIQSFMCNLFENYTLSGIGFRSCHVMDVIKSDQQHVKRAYKDVDDEEAAASKMEMDSGGSRERREAALFEVAI